MPYSALSESSRNIRNSICVCCRKAIRGRSVNVFGRTYHPEHLCCSACGKNLSPSSAKKGPGGSILCTVHMSISCRVCHTCGENISGASCSVDGRFYHPHHLCCTVCGKALGKEGSIYSNGGKVYCHSHYREKFGTKCYDCKQYIDGNCVQALGRTYHPEHFVCHVCRAPMKGSSFRQYEGNPYCEKDFLERVAPRCVVCATPLLGEYAVHPKTGKAYCPQHSQAIFKSSPIKSPVSPYPAQPGKENSSSGSVRCCRCRMELRGSAFNKNGKYFCEKDFWAMFGDRCEVCKEVIKGPKVSANGKFFHPEHFSCAVCRRELRQEKFFVRDGKVYCEKDFYARIAPKCDICSSPMLEFSTSQATRQRYCPGHTKDCIPCFSCRRLHVPDGSVDYPDGRTACPPCHSTAVWRLQEAMKCFGEVKDLFRELKVFDKAALASLEGLQVDLMDRSDLQQQRLNHSLGASGDRSGQHPKLGNDGHADKFVSGGPRCPVGLTRMKVRAVTQTDALGSSTTSVQKQVCGISVLKGLPRMHLLSVLAHEACHVFLFNQGYSRLPLHVEEGLCEIFAYLTLCSLPASEESNLRLSLLHSNVDPIYGGGFQSCLKVWQKMLDPGSPASLKPRRLTRQLSQPSARSNNPTLTHGSPRAPRTSSVAGSSTGKGTPSAGSDGSGAPVRGGATRQGTAPVRTASTRLARPGSGRVSSTNSFVGTTPSRVPYAAKAEQVGSWPMPPSEGPRPQRHRTLNRQAAAPASGLVSPSPSPSSAGTNISKGPSRGSKLRATAALYRRSESQPQLPRASLGATSRLSTPAHAEARRARNTTLGVPRPTESVLVSSPASLLQDGPEAKENAKWAHPRSPIDHTSVKEQKNDGGTTSEKDACSAVHTKSRIAGADGGSSLDEEACAVADKSPSGQERGGRERKDCEAGATVWRDLDRQWTRERSRVSDPKRRAEMSVALTTMLEFVKRHRNLPRL
eukprot:Rmarinus@m.10559